MVSFSNIRKMYGDQVIFDDLNLTVDPGEFVFIIGRSGVGKTTLMRLLTQQVTPDAGSIFIEDIEVGKLKRKDVQKLRRMIGVIYQDYKLLTERTVGENIALGLEIINKPKEEINSRIEDLLQLIGLPGKANLFPTQLSGGEAQRVCIARALATAPRMLFADEPTGNLDDETARSIVRLLSKINELGTTVIMATHNQSLVDHLGKRVVSIEGGKAVEKVKKTKEKGKGE
ncbi:MAG: ATP-binding cassette domain-containing protein [Candidatus Woesebacteria bacterium]